MLPLREMEKLGEEQIWSRREMRNLVIIIISALPPHGVKFDDSCVIYPPNIPYSS